MQAPYRSGAVRALDFQTGIPLRVRWQDGIFSEITADSESTEPPPAQWLAPPLIDLQVNGFSGIDFQQNSPRTEDLLVAARGLRESGCARFLLTLVTDDWKQLTARLRHLVELRRGSPELLQTIAGWHIEGPFLSAKPGFCGAHDPRFMIDPRPEHILELRALTTPDPLLLTLAPERDGAIKAIEAARSVGCTVSLGHTDASSAILADAVQAGATGFTHLGNAIPKEIDRHDNVLWRLLENPELTVSLIPDRIHVSPALFRIVHRLLKTDAIYYTTDAMAAAGAPPGTYSLGAKRLTVGPDLVVREPGSANFAGSALRPVDGVSRATRMLNCSWRDSWRRFSINPARFMGWDPTFGPGREATFCLVTPQPDHGLRTEMVLRGARSAT